LYHAQSPPDSIDNTYCMEVQAVEAFAFLNFFICKVYTVQVESLPNDVIVVLGYTCVLLVFSIIGSTRGNTIWTRSVKEATFLAQKSWPVQQQVPLNQYSGAPPTGYTGTPVSQPQQLGTYHTHSGAPAHTQPQQFQPVYSGQQGISV
jgi:hypothetical protein